MNPHEAHRALAPLILATNGWDDATIEFYARKLTYLDHPDATIEAIDELVTHHTGYGRPTWGQLHDAYQRAVTRKLHGTPTLPRYSGNEHDLATHLRTLDQRAGHGDTNAAHELDTWRRHIAGSTVWASALDAKETA